MQQYSVSMKRRPFRRWIVRIRSCRSPRAGRNAMGLGLTRFSRQLSVYREGVSIDEKRNKISSGVSQANGRIGLGGPQIRGPVQGVWSNGLDDPKMGQASRAISFAVGR